MHRWHRLGIAVLVISLTPWAALAQAEVAERPAPRVGAFGPEAGDFEITLSGSGASESDFDSTDFNISGSFGLFLTRELEISLRQSVNVLDTEDDNQTRASTRGALDFHFDMDRLWPFVGISAGAIYGEGPDDFIVGLEAGVKFYALQKTFLFGMAEYQWPPDESFRDDGQFVYTVGIGFNF